MVIYFAMQQNATGNLLHTLHDLDLRLHRLSILFRLPDLCSLLAPAA